MKSPKNGMAVVIILGISSIAFLNNGCDSGFDESFSNSLKGEIVYLHRDKGILNVYKISARGQEKKLLYHNVDKTNSNCLFPMWSEDGSKIYFTAMKDGNWRRFVMEPDGSNVRIVENEEAWTLSRYSREDDIVVESGSIYYIDENGKKIKTYNFKNYSHDFNPGSSEVSWSPDKQFIIFTLYRMLRSCGIYITNREGTRVAKITEGSDPDWKY